MLFTQSKYILFCLTLGLCLFSCSSTNRLTMRVAQPAPVYLSQEIKSIGIIDRSLPSEKTKTLDKIEKILSAETKDLDQKGAGASIQGLQAELMASQRFSAVKIISIADLKQKGMGVFPAAISWKTLQEIAEANDVDAIFSLAFYDSDTRVNYRVVPRRIANPLGGSLPAVEHQATVNTLIKNGWRVYDVHQQLLLDELIINESFVLNGRIIMYEGLRSSNELEEEPKPAIGTVRPNYGNRKSTIAKEKLQAGLITIWPLSTK